MDARARKALAAVRQCIDAGRYRLLPHSRQRLAERGLLWLDVLVIVDAPRMVRPSGRDRFGRPRWVIGGTAPDGLAIELVCVLDRDERGNLLVFITIY